MCVVLATTRIDVNKSVRKIGTKKASFASPEEECMALGGVTPFGLPSSAVDRQSGYGL